MHVYVSECMRDRGMEEEMIGKKSRGWGETEIWVRDKEGRKRRKRSGQNRDQKRTEGEEGERGWGSYLEVGIESSMLRDQ